MVLIYFTKEIINEIYFYFTRFHKSFRETVKLIKIMYSEGIDFANASIVRNERKKRKELERMEADSKPPSLEKIMKDYEMNGYRVMSPEEAYELRKAFPEESELFVPEAPPELTDLDKSDALIMYRIIFEVYRKGWSHHPDCMDPSFYYINDDGNFAWSSGPKTAKYDFARTRVHTKFSRENYHRIMSKFSNRIRICSYEGFLDYARSQEPLVGGGKKKTFVSCSSLAFSQIDNSVDVSVPFSIIISNVRKSKIFSIPLNCIDKFYSESNYSNCMVNTTASKNFKKLRLYFEYYKICSMYYSVSVRQSRAYAYVSVNASRYKMDFVPESEIEAVSLSRNNIKPGNIEMFGTIADPIDAWKLIGSKSMYGEDYVNGKILGARNHLYLNICVVVGEDLENNSAINVDVGLFLNMEFFSRFPFNLVTMESYIRQEDRQGMCHHCDQRYENSESSQKDSDDEPAPQRRENPPQWRET